MGGWVFLVTNTVQATPIYDVTLDFGLAVEGVHASALHVIAVKLNKKL